MGTAVFVAVLCFVACSTALECGIGKVNSEEVKKTLSMCIKNNETLERIWEMAASSATPSPVSTESDSDSSSVEDQPQAQSARLSRGRRASNIQEKTVAPPEEQTDKSDVSTTPSTLESADACIVQCVFKQLGLTDDGGFPDHSKIVEGLLKNATGRELQIFLQEAAGECFQQTERESNTDPCVHSSKLVTCLANKGRMNCEDWPAGNLPF